MSASCGMSTGIHQLQSLPRCTATLLSPYVASCTATPSSYLCAAQLHPTIATHQHVLCHLQVRLTLADKVRTQSAHARTEVCILCTKCWLTLGLGSTSATTLRTCALVTNMQLLRHTSASGISIYLRLCPLLTPSVCLTRGLGLSLCRHTCKLCILVNAHKLPSKFVSSSLRFKPQDPLRS